jgi:hypothetical protein
MRYSYSNLATWQKCPRQWEAKYVLRSWPDEPPAPALIRGKAVHAALECAVRDGADVPDDVWLPDGLIPLLQLGHARVEDKLEVTDPAHIIGYLDVALVTEDKAHVIDWKTGKLRPDPLQADVYAMLARRVWSVDEVTFTWVGVDSKKAVTSQPDDNAERRVMSIINDIESNGKYPPTPSWLCRFCPLKWCEHNEKR